MSHDALNNPHHPYANCLPSPDRNSNVHIWHLAVTSTKKPKNHSSPKSPLVKNHEIQLINMIITKNEINIDKPIETLQTKMLSTNHSNKHTDFLLSKKNRQKKTKKNNKYSKNYWGDTPQTPQAQNGVYLFAIR
jgi:hypothetical protein